MLWKCWYVNPLLSRVLFDSTQIWLFSKWYIFRQNHRLFFIFTHDFVKRKQYKLLLVQVYFCMKNTSVVWKCNISMIFIYCVLLLTKHSLHGQDYRVVQFISTYVIGVYCHRNCEFDTFPWSGVLNTTYFSGCPVS